MNIRPARDGDFAGLARLHKASFAEAWNERALQGLIASGASACLAEDSGRLAGFVLFRTASDEAEILTVAVAPEARRNGLGRALVTLAASLAAQSGATRLFLEVAANNAAARALYGRLGFVPAGHRKGYYRTPGKPPEDALVLSVPLPLSGLGNDGGVDYSARLTGGDKDLSRIEKLCVEKGLRMTEQRRVIARVLSDATDHPDAEELYRRASAVDPHISIATVYRTVKLFEDAGILERHDFRDGRSRYEEIPESHHDHLIDVQSGRVVEFRNEDIEKLQRMIAEELGFELVDHRLELYGVPKGGRTAKR
jgi:Fur family ferric uptake transcriptional regulator